MIQAGGSLREKTKMADNENDRKAGYDYAQSNPYAEKPSPSSYPSYEQKIGFENGFDQARKEQNK